MFYQIKSVKLFLKCEIFASFQIIISNHFFSSKLTFVIEEIPCTNMNHLNSNKNSLVLRKMSHIFSFDESLNLNHKDFIFCTKGKNVKLRRCNMTFLLLSYCTVKY